MSDETCERIQAWTISAADRTVTTEGPDTDPCTGETITRTFVEATPLTLAADELLAVADECRKFLVALAHYFIRMDGPMPMTPGDLIAMIDAAKAKAEGRQAR